MAIRFFINNIMDVVRDTSIPQFLMDRAPPVSSYQGTRTGVVYNTGIIAHNPSLCSVPDILHPAIAGRREVYGHGQEKQRQESEKYFFHECEG